MKKTADSSCAFLLAGGVTCESTWEMGGEQQIWTILRVCVLTFIFPRRNMEGFSVVNDIGLIQTDLSQSGSYGPGNGQAQGFQ